MAPYSVAARAGRLIFISGQVALKPEGGRAGEDIVEQTRTVMDNIGALLGDLGLDYSDIVKTTIFMADINDYAAINEVYGGYFPADPPARSAVQAAALPGGFRVEIEVIAAARPDSG